MVGVFIGLLKSLFTKKLKFVIPIVIISFALWQGKAIRSFAIKYLPIKKLSEVKVDKADPMWLRKYCAAEVKNLPNPPFSHNGLDGDVHFLSIPATYIGKLIPSDKRSGNINCSLWYKYDTKTAYESVAVEYVVDIKAVNAFEENVEKLISESIVKSWRKISPLNEKDAGQPVYAYKGFPLVFTREKSDLGTVEYANFAWGGNTFFITLTVYEK